RMIRPAPRAEENRGAPEGARGPDSPRSTSLPPRERRNRGQVNEVPRRPLEALEEDASLAYARTLKAARDLINGLDGPFLDGYTRAMAALDANYALLAEGPLLLKYTFHSTADSYLYGHTANTAIIAQAAGLALGLGAEDLRLLAFGALAHDAGMTEFEEMVSRDVKLVSSELDRLRLHPELGADKLDRLLDIDYKDKERLKRIISQTHERADGAGYPAGLGAEAIDPLAQIIAAADVYEALTHPRSWRGPMDPHAAMKEMIDKYAQAFGQRAVRGLVSALTVYPPNSFVRLSTGETARVIMVNRRSLTRPAVEVLLDADLAEMTPQEIDLAEHPLTAVEREVPWSELAAKAPAFAARYELARWWRDW
ncbi:MAG: HD domain-containing protein, partial [Elusimicrobiales bacterium]|nr:HD domain-containing protein [Elusimicrobiales bacterium]